MRNISFSNGKTVEVECLSCALTSGVYEPEGGVVVETEYFHAHQDVAYPIRGLIILASKRHIKCFDELTEEERNDYINTLSKIRKVQREVLDIPQRIFSLQKDNNTQTNSCPISNALLNNGEKMDARIFRNYHKKPYRFYIIVGICPSSW